MSTAIAKQIGALSIMRFLFATLALDRNVIIDLANITKNIYDFKSKLSPEKKCIFDDIEFRAGINSVVSSDIESSIKSLQTFGVIGKLNPAYDKLVVFYTEQDAESVLENCPDDLREELRRLAASFG